MKNLITSLIFILYFSFYSCTHLDAEYQLSQAESELQAGNVELALSSCEALTDSTATSLNSTQMCRVAIIYAKASESSNNHDYMVTATECLDKAIQLDADTDSLDIYINNLDIENQSVVNAIREVSQIMKTPFDLSDRDFEHTDSVQDVI